MREVPRGLINVGMTNCIHKHRHGTTICNPATSNCCFTMLKVVICVCLLAIVTEASKIRGRACHSDSSTQGFIRESFPAHSQVGHLEHILRLYTSSSSEYFEDSPPTDRLYGHKSSDRMSEIDRTKVKWPEIRRAIYDDDIEKAVELCRQNRFIEVPRRALAYIIKRKTPEDVIKFLEKSSMAGEWALRVLYQRAAIEMIDKVFESIDFSQNIRESARDLGLIALPAEKIVNWLDKIKNPEERTGRLLEVIEDLGRLARYVFPWH